MAFLPTLKIPNFMLPLPSPPRISSSFVLADPSSGSNDNLVETEYESEIISFMTELENATQPNPNYMEHRQPTLTWKMRKTLVVWLIQVHREYGLRAETLFLTINLIDRYCSLVPVDRTKFQLVGITCFWIACKYEENHGRVPSMKNLVYMCCSSFSQSHFSLMETRVLAVLGFRLGHVTCESFLQRLLKLNSMEHLEVHPEIATLARFLLEISLCHRRFLFAKPSILVHSCLLLANYILTQSTILFPFYQKAPLSPSFMEQVEYYKNSLIDCLVDVPKILLEKYGQIASFATQWTQDRSHSFIPHLFHKLSLNKPTVSMMYESGHLTPPKESIASTFSYPVQPSADYFSGYEGFYYETNVNY